MMDDDELVHFHWGFECSMMIRWNILLANRNLKLDGKKENNKFRVGMAGEGAERKILGELATGGGSGRSTA